MDILVVILTVNALAMILWLAVKGVGAAVKGAFPVPKEEYPYEHVRLIMDTDKSGRFEAYAHRRKDTGIYEAFVHTRRDDVFVPSKTVTSATKEELEHKVMDAYEEMAKEWKEEIEFRRRLNGTSRQQKRRKK